MRNIITYRRTSLFRLTRRASLGIELKLFCVDVTHFTTMSKLNMLFISILFYLVELHEAEKSILAIIDTM